MIFRTDKKVLDEINTKLVQFLNALPGDCMIEWDDGLNQTDIYIRYRLTTRACLAILRRNAIKSGK